MECKEVGSIVTVTTDEASSVREDVTSDSTTKVPVSIKREYFDLDQLHCEPQQTFLTELIKLAPFTYKLVLEKDAVILCMFNQLQQPQSSGRFLGSCKNGDEDGMIQRGVTQDSVVRFCMEWGFIASSPICKKCNTLLKWTLKPALPDGFVWRCHNRKCVGRTRYCSIRQGSWLSESKMPLDKILLLTYCWAAQVTNAMAAKETTTVSGGTSLHTVVDWYTFFRQACFQMIQHGSRKAIGGPGRIVEIDACKFGKRKIRLGSTAKGKWVLGGFCHQTKEAFLINVETRASETLIPLMKEHVAAGSLVITDSFKSGRCLSEEILTYLMVNHGLDIVDPDRIPPENASGHWWQIKRKLPCFTARAKELLGFHFAEYMWRQQHSATDHFERILKDLLVLHKPPKLF